MEEKNKMIGISEKMEENLKKIGKGALLIVIALLIIAAAFAVLGFFVKNIVWVLLVFVIALIVTIFTFYAKIHRRRYFELHKDGKCTFFIGISVRDGSREERIVNSVSHMKNIFSKKKNPA